MPRRAARPLRRRGQAGGGRALRALAHRGPPRPVLSRGVGRPARPRPPAEIVGGDGGDVLDGTARILTGSGADVTGEFLRGARLALEAARRAGARLALLKEGSPSCGGHRVHDGTFTGTSVPGSGVTTALLRRSGIHVFSEDELGELDALLGDLEA